MKRILLFFALLYSSYSFCGCSGGYFQINLNGKAITCLPCGPGFGGYPAIIDSTYFFGISDIVDSNNAILTFQGDADLVTISCYTFTGDTFRYQLNNSPFKIRYAGVYWFDMSDKWFFCDATMSLTFRLGGTSEIPAIQNESDKIQVLSNPVSSILKLNSQLLVNSLNIYDELGRLQLSPSITSTQNTYETNVDGLSKGVYTIEVLSGLNKKDYIKIVKQ